MFSEIQWPDNGTNDNATTRKAFSLADHLSIDDVRRVLSRAVGAVFIIDEFDQSRRVVSKEFTELIKALSDLGVDCTIILVGVSETVENLVTVQVDSYVGSRDLTG